MAYKPITIEWFDLPDWHEGPLNFLSEPGLLQFWLNGRIEFIGYAANADPGLAGRIAAYRRGDVKSHRAAQEIARLKHQLELRLAIVHLPRAEIRWIANELKRKHSPRLNRRNPFPGRI